MDDFTKRRNQVIDEKLRPLPTKGEPFVSLFTLQQHDALKAGKHYDHRIIVGNKAISFVNRTGLPKKPGEKKLVIKMPDHKADYALWSGKIPTGQYGAGTVKVIDLEPAVIKIPNKQKLDLRIYRGPNTGNYVYLATKDPDKWIVIRRKSMPDFYTERMKFSGKVPESVWTDPRYIAEEKKHGAMYYGVLSDKGISFISRRKSKKGDTIHREENIPHLRDIKIPKRLQGTVVAGEMDHPKGFHFLSGLMNSAPDKAVETQRIFGKASYFPFELAELPHRKTEFISYGERRKIIGDIIRTLGSRFIKQPRAEMKYKKEFYKRLSREGVEGVVLKNLDKGYGKDTWYRKTPLAYYDAKITGFLPGEGKYKGKAIGVMVVEDREGKSFNVGTGFSDDLRIDMFKNPKRYIGKLVKIKKRKNIPAPVFSLDGFTIDKDTPDIIPAYEDSGFKQRLLGQGIPPEDVSKVKYAILSSMRLKKKAEFLPPVVKIYKNSFSKELKWINILTRK